MTAVWQGHYQDKFCRVRSDVSKGLQEANFLQSFLHTGEINGVKCLGEVHSATHVAILSICHWQTGRVSGLQCHGITGATLTFK